ncbi:MAG: cold-shock protein [Pirellulales bacterium]
MPTGTIKKLVAEKGFGFIAGERGDVFFHHSVVADRGFDDLQEGQSVDYTLEEDAGKSKGGKGPRAASVTPN